MDVFELNVSSVLTLNLVEHSPVMDMVMAVFGLQMDLIVPIMEALLEDPNFRDSGLVEFGWDFVLDQVLDFLEVIQNLVVHDNNLVTHLKIIKS